jgi:hypothetical protein
LLGPHAFRILHLASLSSQVGNEHKRDRHFLARVLVSVSTVGRKADKVAVFHDVGFVVESNVNLAFQNENVLFGISLMWVSV